MEMFDEVAASFGRGCVWGETEGHAGWPANRTKGSVWGETEELNWLNVN